MKKNYFSIIVVQMMHCLTHLNKIQLMATLTVAKNEL